MNALIIQSDSIVSMILEMYLKDLGFKVRIQQDLNDGVRDLYNGYYDLIITEIFPSKEVSLTYLQQCLKLPYTKNIVVISDKLSMDQALSLMEAGINAYCSTVDDVVILRELLQAVWDGRRFFFIKVPDYNSLATSSY